MIFECRKYDRISLQCIDNISSSEILWVYDVTESQIIAFNRKDHAVILCERIFTDIENLVLYRLTRIVHKRYKRKLVFIVTFCVFYFVISSYDSHEIIMSIENWKLRDWEIRIHTQSQKSISRFETIFSLIIINYNNCSLIDYIFIPNILSKAVQNNLWYIIFLSYLNSKWNNLGTYLADWWCPSTRQRSFAMTCNGSCMIIDHQSSPWVRNTLHHWLQIKIYDPTSARARHKSFDMFIAWRPRRKEGSLSFIFYWHWHPPFILARSVNTRGSRDLYVTSYTDYCMYIVTFIFTIYPFHDIHFIISNWFLESDIHIRNISHQFFLLESAINIAIIFLLKCWHIYVYSIISAIPFLFLYLYVTINMYKTPRGT